VNLSRLILVCSYIHISKKIVTLILGREYFIHIAYTAPTDTHICMCSKKIYRLEMEFQEKTGALDLYSLT
jgi:hypothetical protein